MDELEQIMETAKQMAMKLESREILADSNHVAQVWHCMRLLAHHIQQINVLAAQRKVGR